MPAPMLAPPSQQESRFQVTALIVVTIPIRVRISGRRSSSQVS